MTILAQRMFPCLMYSTRVNYQFKYLLRSVFFLLIAVVVPSLLPRTSGTRCGDDCLGDDFLGDDFLFLQESLLFLLFPCSCLGVFSAERCFRER